MLWHRGKAYSQELRQRFSRQRTTVSRSVGSRIRCASVSPTYPRSFVRRRTGQTTALAQRCHVPPRLTNLRGAIQTQVAARPDATIAGLRAWLSKTHQVSASTGLMWKTLAALDLTFKKKSLHAAEQERPDVAKARTEWRVKQPSLAPSKLVFIDETCDQDKYDPALWPGATWQATGRCRAAWSLEDLDLYWRPSLRGCDRAGVFDGAINGELFLAYVEQVSSRR